MLQFCQKDLTKIIQNVHTFEARHDMLSFSAGPNKQNRALIDFRGAVSL